MSSSIADARKRLRITRRTWIEADYLASRLASVLDDVPPESKVDADVFSDLVAGWVSSFFQSENPELWTGDEVPQRPQKAFHESAEEEFVSYFRERRDQIDETTRRVLEQFSVGFGMLPSAPQDAKVEFERIGAVDRRIIKGIHQAFQAGISALTDEVGAREKALSESVSSHVNNLSTAEGAGSADAKDVVYENVDALAPVALLPIRLETRFFDTEEGPELRVRMYPDQVHLDRHESYLTEPEARAGQKFWALVGSAIQKMSEGNSEGGGMKITLPDQFSSKEFEPFKSEEDNGLSAGGGTSEKDRFGAVKERAWANIVERFGRERGSWIVHQTAPQVGLNPEILLSPSFDDDGSFNESEGLTDTAIPELDNLKLRAKGWSNPSWARALPDQWHVEVQWNGEDDTEAIQTTSKPVQEPLPAFPDPLSADPSNEENSEEQGSSAPFEGTKANWMVDFEEAERVGMGVRINLTNLQLPDDADLKEAEYNVIVWGLKSSMDEEEGRNALTRLLEAHHHTDGFEILETGTPTNNADEQSGYVEKRPPSESMSVHLEASLLENESDEPTDGKRLSDALGGLTRDGRNLLEHVRGAEHAEQRQAKNMNTVLWPATLGYAARHIFTSVSEGRADISEKEYGRLTYLRRHFIESVRAGGPLPAIRCGTQPYGILPISPLETFQKLEEPAVSAATGSALGDLPYPSLTYTGEPSLFTDAAGELIDWLKSLKQVWLKHAAEAPHWDDEGTDVLDLLSMRATSNRYQIRRLIGEKAFDELFDSDVSFPETGLSTRREFLRDALRGQGGSDHDSFEAFLNNLRIFGGDEAKFLYLPWTTDLGALDAENLDNFINHLVEVEDGHGWENFPIEFQRFFDLVANSLPEKLIWFAKMRQLVATRERFKAGTSAPKIYPDPQVTDFGQKSDWDRLSEVLNDGLRDKSHFQDFQDSLTNLRGMETEDLERRMAQTLDLASHRLDAWLTSIATRRLESIRHNTLSQESDESGSNSSNDSDLSHRGLLVGAYGFVEGLTWDGNDESSDGEEFIHAPSLDQATTAAILRSGYRAHRDDSMGEGLAINLSSERVRRARWLLDGVRKGQKLGSLLGYRFERSLHEKNLEKYIDDFREIAPSVAGKMERDDTEEPSETNKIRDVVDGKDLLRHWEEDSLEKMLDRIEYQGEIPSEDKNTLRTVFNDLEDTLDAVKDLLTAEGVHQMAQGNPSRAGAALEALSRGERPPEPEVIETPRTGTTVTHRLGVLCNENKGPDSSQNGDGSSDDGGDRSPRAQAEPYLEAWAQGILGKLDKYGCTVKYLGEEYEVTAKDVGLDALDVVYLSGLDEDGQRSELAIRVLFKLKRRVENSEDVEEMQDTEDVTIHYDRTRKDHSFVQMLEVARSLRELFDSSRALTPEDVVPPHRTSKGNRSVHSDRLPQRKLEALLDNGAGLPSAITDEPAPLRTYSLKKVDGQLNHLLALKRICVLHDDQSLRRQSKKALEGLRSLSEIDSKVVDELRDFEQLLEWAKKESERRRRWEDFWDNLLERLQPRLDPELLATTLGGSGFPGRLRASGFRGESSEEDSDENGQEDSVDEPIRDPQSLNAAELADEIQSRVEEGTLSMDPQEIRERIQAAVDAAAGDQGSEERKPAILKVDWSDLKDEFEGNLKVLTQIVRLLNVDWKRLFDSGKKVNKLFEKVGRGDYSSKYGVDFSPEVDSYRHSLGDSSQSSPLVDALGEAGASLMGFGKEDWKGIRQWSQLWTLVRRLNSTNEDQNPASEEKLSRQFVRSALSDIHSALDALENSNTNHPLKVFFQDDLKKDWPNPRDSDWIDSRGGQNTDTVGRKVKVVLDHIREKLLDAAKFGIPEAVPSTVTGRDAETQFRLARRIRSVISTLEDRRQHVDGLDTSQLKDYLGGEMLILPTLTFPTPAAQKQRIEEASPSEEGADGATGSEDIAAETMLHRVSEVKERPKLLRRATSYGTLLGQMSNGSSGFSGRSWWLGQTSGRSEWVGRDKVLPEDDAVTLMLEDRLSPGDTLGEKVVGFLVDEWSLTYPRPAAGARPSSEEGSEPNLGTPEAPWKQETGVAFRYNQPDARAPQSILLGVPPNGESWRASDLRDIIEEARKLLRVRSVDSKLLSDLSSVLPALFYPTSSGAVPDDNGGELPLVFSPDLGDLTDE